MIEQYNTDEMQLHNYDLQKQRIDIATAVAPQSHLSHESIDTLRYVFPNVEVEIFPLRMNILGCVPRAPNLVATLPNNFCRNAPNSYFMDAGQSNSLHPPIKLRHEKLVGVGGWRIRIAP